MARTEVIVKDGKFDADAFEGGGLYPYDPKFTDLEMSETPFTVFEYLRQLEKGKVVIQPDFQRNQIWSIKQKSRFIESIILNFPLPPIYLNETKDAKYIVIDGLQRTTALDEFYKNSFKLSQLEAIPDYNGKTFNDLDEIIQSKFEDKKLTTYILKPSTPTKVIYDLFNRINTGGTQLNRQEVRNCIFIGKATELLKRLSEMDIFHAATDGGISGRRMKDREVILRYLSFRWLGYSDKYEGDMSSFIERFMSMMNVMEDSHLLMIEDDFERVMSWTYSLWEDQNFRIPKDGERRGTINTAVFETICYFIAHQDDSYLNQNREAVYNNYFLLFQNDRYYESVTKATGNKAKVVDRFEIATEILATGTL